jgi:hypothetical protein
MKTSPTTTVTPPSTIEICRLYSHSHSPSAPERVPSTTNQTVKPSTNRKVPASIRPRRAVSRSAPESPVA